MPVLQAVLQRHSPVLPDSDKVVDGLANVRHTIYLLFTSHLATARLFIVSLNCLRHSCVDGEFIDIHHRVPSLDVFL